MAIYIYNWLSMICTEKACGGDEERMEVIDYIYTYPILIDKTARYELI